VALRAVASGYFQAMGIRLLRGRGIDRADIDRNEPVAVVNEALANAYFPNHDPIGERVSFGNPQNRTWTWLSIVGIVSDTPTSVLAEVTRRPKLYMPMSLAAGPEMPSGPNIGVMSYVVRSTASPCALVASVRRAIDRADRTLALARVRTLQEILDGASAQMGFTMVLLAIATTVALLLGVVGIYGVTSYIVSQRMTEIGVRLALGAEPAGVAGMITRQGGVVVVAGLAVGLALALAGSRLIESLLYGVSSRDPGVFTVTMLTLLVIALLACWLPARRAARVDPMEAMRSE